MNSRPRSNATPRHKVPGRTGYTKYGCRCPECKQANTDYHRQWDWEWQNRVWLRSNSQRAKNARARLDAKPADPEKVAAAMRERRARLAREAQAALDAAEREKRR